MVLILGIVSLVVFLIRIFQKKVSRGELVVVGLIVLHTIITQMILVWDREEWRVDERYLIPAFPLLVVYMIVFLRELGFTWILKLALLGFSLYSGFMASKCLMPFSSRAEKLAACRWAKAVIENDWIGPKYDKPHFSIYHYYYPKRPLIGGIARVAADLDGRTSAEWIGKRDAPDYFFSEESKINFSIWNRKEYNLLSEKKFGKHKYLIYKRAFH